MTVPSENFDQLFGPTWWEREREACDDEGPVLMLELPSEESSRRPSKCCERSGSPGKWSQQI